MIRLSPAAQEAADQLASARRWSRTTAANIIIELAATHDDDIVAWVREMEGNEALDGEGK